MSFTLCSDLRGDTLEAYADALNVALGIVRTDAPWRFAALGLPGAPIAALQNTGAALACNRKMRRARTEAAQRWHSARRIARIHSDRLAVRNPIPADVLHGATAPDASAHPDLMPFCEAWEDIVRRTVQRTYSSAVRLRSEAIVGLRPQFPEWNGVDLPADAILPGTGSASGGAKNNGNADWEFVSIHRGMDRAAYRSATSHNRRLAMMLEAVANRDVDSIPVEAKRNESAEAHAKRTEAFRDSLRFHCPVNAIPGGTDASRVANATGNAGAASAREALRPVDVISGVLPTSDMARKIGRINGFALRSARFKTAEGVTIIGGVDTLNDFTQEVYCVALEALRDKRYSRASKRRNGTEVKSRLVVKNPFARAADHVRRAYRGTGIGRGLRARLKTVRQFRASAHSAEVYSADRSLSSNRAALYCSLAGGNAREFQGSARIDDSSPAHNFYVLPDVKTVDVSEDVKNATDSLSPIHRTIAMMLAEGKNVTDIGSALRPDASPTTARQWAHRNVTEVKRILREALASYAD